MKAILEFNLPEDDNAHKDAIEATTFKGAMQEFDDFLRSINKHGHEDFKTVTEQQAAQKIRAELHKQLENAGVKLWY